jgi:hypothetical protein
MALPILACNLRLCELHNLSSSFLSTTASFLSTAFNPKNVLQKNANRALTEMPGGRGIVLLETYGALGKILPWSSNC